MTQFLEVNMCGNPFASSSAPRATQFQASRDPIRRENSSGDRRRGRAGRSGTILSSPSSQGEVSVSNKKTQLGT